jgi:hypothetical protein
MLDSLARDTLVHMAAHWVRLADFHEASRNLQDISQLIARGDRSAHVPS